MRGCYLAGVLERKRHTDLDSASHMGGISCFFLGLDQNSGSRFFMESIVEALYSLTVLRGLEQVGRRKQ